MCCMTDLVHFGKLLKYSNKISTLLYKMGQVTFTCKHMLNYNFFYFFATCIDCSYIFDVKL